MFKIVAITLLLTACGPEFRRQPSGHSGVDAELQPLLDEWVAKMHDAQVDISRLSVTHKIEYVDSVAGEFNIENVRIGLCVQDWEHWHVYIKKTKQDNVRRAVLWHELGHCVLDMDHAELPGEIMFAYIPDSSNYWDRVWPEAVENYIVKAKNPNE